MNCPHCNTCFEREASQGAMVLCPSCRKHFIVGVDAVAATRQTTPETVPEAQTIPHKKLLIYAGIGIAALIGLAMMLAIGAIIFSSSSRSMVSKMPVADVIAVVCQSGLNDEKQKIFDALHPVGTAKSVKLHEVHIDSWRPGRSHDQVDGVKEFTITYTLYWAGPLTKDGYTKIRQTYDAEVERYVSSKILNTNGTTNGEIVDGVFDVGASLLLDSLSGS